MKYIYDIYLDDALVGDSGDEIFDTEEEAKADADDYIISTLEDEHEKGYKDFEVVIYESEDGNSFVSYRKIGEIR